LFYIYIYIYRGVAVLSPLLSHHQENKERKEKKLSSQVGEKEKS
jgi:hypothetical protein